MDNKGSVVVVFGGTGFLGRRVVEALQGAGLRPRVAVRHAERLQNDAGVDAVRADVTDRASVRSAIGGDAAAVVNCVGLYAETAGASFEAVHVEGARTVAEAAAAAKAERLIHISGIGADAASQDPYVRARGAGEEAVCAAFDDAVVFRPSVMFGPGDAFLSGLDRVTAMMPVIPLFGSGAMRLQPVFVDDVAHAVASAVRSELRLSPLYELGGPEIITYAEVVQRVLTWTGRHRLLVPFPFICWEALARVSALLPSPPVTPAVVALMRADNVARETMPDLSDLGIAATPIAQIAPRLFGGA